MIDLTSSLRRKLRILKWLFPLGLVFLVIAYELGPSRWINYRLGFNYHLVAEIFLFGTIGPAFAFLLLELFARWIEERETAEVQSNLLARAQKKELEVRQINHDTIQVLFATGLLIATFKSDQSAPPSISAAQLEVTEQALNEAIQRLSSH